MNLLFDIVATQPNASGQRHGGGKYGEIVFQRMLEMGIRPICYYRSRFWLNPGISQLIQHYHLTLIDLDHVALEDIIRDNHIDTLYSCLPSSKILKLQCCKVKATLHGLRNVETPYDSIFWRYREIKWRTRMRFILEKYSPKIGLHYQRNTDNYKMFAENPRVEFAMVSHHSALSFLCYFPQYKEREIPVFYSPNTSLPHSIATRFYTEKYFFMVSGNRWEKNCLRAIQALDRLFSTGFLDGYRVKITGAKNEHIYKYQLQNPERFDFLGYVTDPQLEQLYHDSYALIYPSLNEGFGYPPLEAMRYGVPVLTSSYGSIPEVCQGAVLYFNPTSVEEIMNRILFLTTDLNLYTCLQKLGVQQYSLIAERQKKDLDNLIEWIVNGNKK